MKKNSRNKKVIVMGAGLAGLACAHELAKNGQEVVVIEKNAWVGGLAHTFKVGDFRFDTGPHRWFTKSNEADHWFKELMGDRLIRVPRLTRIYFDKKFFYYPMRFVNIFRLGIFSAFRALWDYFLIRLKTKFKVSKIISMEDAYTDQFGKTLYEKFFKRYSEKLWGRPCSELSGDWVVQRSRRMSLTTVIKDLFFGSKGKVVSLTDFFFFPKLGIGEVTDKLQEEIKKKKGKIILDASVTEIICRGKKVVGVEIKIGGKKQIIKADEFVSSIPLTELIQIMRPKPPKEVLRSARQLSYRSEIFVALFIEGRKIFPDNWIYVHPLEIPFMRLVVSDNFSPTMVPPGKTSLVFEIPCHEDDEIWRKDDPEIVKWVSQSFLNEFKVIDSKDIIKGVVYRHAKTYPVYDLGYQPLVKMLKDFVHQFSNLQIIGRYGMFRYNNMDHSVLTGLYAARNIMGAKYDIENVNLEREYLEEKKIK